MSLGGRRKRAMSKMAVLCYAVLAEPTRRTVRAHLPTPQLGKGVTLLVTGGLLKVTATRASFVQQG